MKKTRSQRIFRNSSKGAKYNIPVKKALFALSPNWALNPDGKLALVRWVNEKAAIVDLEEIVVQNLYRAMDFLLEADEQIQEDVYYTVAHLFNLEVDLMYFNTTTTCFEIEEDEFRKKGFSKDHRPDLPQVAIGLAVTKEGFPVRNWSWSRNTADMSIVEEVKKKDLTDWRLGRVITVPDRGFVSE